MVKHIILPTDFSNNSWNAICYAIDLFKYQACEFYVLHTFTPNTYVSNPAMTAQFGQMQVADLKENATKMLKRLSRKIAFKDPLPHHNFNYIADFDLLLDGINALVTQKQADLVVMGTKGATDAIDVLLGGNTLKVMEQLRQCPVLMIPQEAKYKAPKEIVFPTSYESNYNPQELQHLIAIAKLSKATICVLYVGDSNQLNPIQKQNQAQLKEIFKAVSHSIHAIDEVNLETAIHCFVQSRNSDMISFINSKHKFLSTLFKRPLVKELGYHSKLPVLTLHA